MAVAHVQKQLPEVFYKKRRPKTWNFVKKETLVQVFLWILQNFQEHLLKSNCFKKFHKILRKTPLMDSIFIKVAGSSSAA